MHSKDLSKQSSWAVEVLSVILSLKINGGTVMDVLAAVARWSFVWYPSHSRLNHPGWWEAGTWRRGWDRCAYNSRRAIHAPVSSFLPGLAYQWAESVVT